MKRGPRDWRGGGVKRGPRDWGGGEVKEEEERGAIVSTVLGK